MAMINSVNVTMELAMIREEKKESGTKHDGDDMSPNNVFKRQP